MYIEFSDDYAAALQSQQGCDLWKPIEHAYNAFRNHYHFIFCESRNCANTISKYAVKKNRNDIAILFKTIHDNFTQIGTIKSKLLVYTSIIPELDLCKISDDKKEIQIGINIAKKSELWEKTIFLPENIDDDCYFRIIIDTQKELKNNSLCYLDYNYEPDNGGGSSSYRTLLRKGNQPHFIFGIFDSDSKNPKKPSKLGDTSKLVTKKTYPANVGYIILQLQEMENLFYSESFIKKYADKNKKQLILNQHQKIKETYPEYEKFFDTKTGYTIKNAYDDYDFLIPYINKDEVKCVEYQNHSQTCQKCAECSVHVFATCGNEIKNKIKVNFYDENKQVTKNIQNIIPIIKSSPEYIQKEWERIFENSISWFCYCKLESRA